MQCLMGRYPVCARRACLVIRMTRSPVYYKSRKDPLTGLRQRMCGPPKGRRVEVGGGWVGGGSPPAFKSRTALYCQGLYPWPLSRRRNSRWRRHCHQWPMSEADVPPSSVADLFRVRR